MRTVIRTFNPLVYPFPWLWQKLKGNFTRNHRKIVTIDESVGFMGGMNIAEKYAGKQVGGTGLYPIAQLHS